MRTIGLLALLGVPCVAAAAHATAMFFGGSLHVTGGSATLVASAPGPTVEIAAEPRDLLPTLELDAPDAAIDAWRDVEADPLEAPHGSAAAAEVSAAPPACADSFDNDGDGLADFPADPGCITPGSVTEQPRCQDGIDTDRDGSVDFDGGASLHGGEPIAPPDPECAGAPWRDRERP